MDKKAHVFKKNYERYLSKIQELDFIHIAEFLGLKIDQHLITELCGGLDGITAHLAIFHIGLFYHGDIQQKGNFFPTIWTLKKMLVHGLKVNIEQLSANLKHLEFRQFCIVLGLAFGQFGI